MHREKERFFLSDKLIATILKNEGSFQSPPVCPVNDTAYSFQIKGPLAFQWADTLLISQPGFYCETFAGACGRKLIDLLSSHLHWNCSYQPKCYLIQYFSVLLKQLNWIVTVKLCHSCPDGLWSCYTFIHGLSYVPHGRTFWLYQSVIWFNIKRIWDLN